MNYPLSVVRTLALHCQHLTSNPTKPDDAQLMRIITQIGGLQIDTLQRVQRSHYIALWSRAGNYDPTQLESFLNDPPRRLFEYWLHAACMIPFEYYRYMLPKMARYKAREGHDGWVGNWVKENDDLLRQVLGRIKAEGALRTSHFEDPREERGSWWDWKPAKHALEHLYNVGHLMTAGRVKFQRVYDLAERVLPPQVDTAPPTDEEAYRFLAELSVKALGVCSPNQAADYTYMGKTIARPIIQEMLKEGVVTWLHTELANGKTADLLIHRDNLPFLQQSADGAIKAELTTFLSPFDNCFWAHEWEMHLWGFEHRVEAYTPAPKRRWGYLCYPILHRDRLVGRFDPKLDRKAGILRLEHLHLEPGVAMTPELLDDIAEAMRRFMTFHKATELVVEHSDPDPFGEQLLAVVSATI